MIAVYHVSNKANGLKAITRGARELANLQKIVGAPPASGPVDGHTAC